MRIVVVKREEIDRLYERFKGMPANHMYRGDEGYAFFRKALMDSLLVVEYPFGIIRFTDYKPGRSVDVHTLFDSKEVFRSGEQLLEAAQYVFDHLGVKFIEATFPAGSRALRRLVEGIGFEHVRTLRQGLYNGIMHVDGVVYRLRRE